MKTKKVRRHSGRVWPSIQSPQMKWNDIKSNALEPSEFWDDWTDYRDGFRDYEGLKRKKRDLKKRKTERR